MFSIGEKVVYPNQGVGIINVIEEKEFNGEMKSYYKIHLLNNNMELMFPFSRVKPTNMRLISDPKTLDNNLNSLKEYESKIDELSNVNFKERNAINMEKIKVGTFKECLEVVYSLTKINLQHSLNSSEREMLRKTKKIVIEEISQVKELSKDEANKLLDFSIQPN